MHACFLVTVYSYSGTGQLHFSLTAPKSNQALRQFPEMALLANGKAYYRMQRVPINGNKAKFLSSGPP